MVHGDQCRTPQALILWVGLSLMVRPISYTMGTQGYTPTAPIKIYMLSHMIK
jgi:hypothetical protein